MPSAEKKHDDEATFVIGATEARKKVLPWLKRYLEGPDRPKRSVNLVLRTLGAKGKESADPIDTQLYDFADPLEQVAEEIVDLAEEDALECTGRVKYALRIEGHAAAGRCSFSLKREARLDDDDEEDFDDAGEIDEDTSARGRNHQQMRHNEVLVKEVVGMSREARKEHKGELEELRARVKERDEQLFAQGKEMIKLYEDLRSLQWMRDREIQKMESEERKSEQLMKTLMRVAPVLAAAVFGGANADTIVQSLLKAALPALTEGDETGARSAGAGAKSGGGGETLEQIADQLMSALERDPQKIVQIAQFLSEEEQKLFDRMYRSVLRYRQKGGTQAAS